MQQRAAAHRDRMARFMARVGLLVLQRAVDRIGDVLDERAAERDSKQLLSAADAQDRHVARERILGERKFGGGAAFLQRYGRMPVGIAVQRWVDIEGTAGDHQSVDAVKISVGECGVVRQCDRQAAGSHDRLGIVLPDRIPGILRVAAGLLRNRA